REDLRSRSRRVIAQVVEPKMRAFLMTAADESLDDSDWLEALATTVSARPPSSWKDNDVTIFEALLAERAHWFRRLELLHHQMHGPDSLGFDVHRITFTAPAGREAAELVSVAHPEHELVVEMLDEAMSQLQDRLGENARSALLGVLAEGILSGRADTVTDMAIQRLKLAEK